MTDRQMLMRLDQHATTRDFAGMPIEVRGADADEVILDGYASVTGVWYAMYGGPPYGWEEQIAPGAFTKTLSEKPDVVLLVNHQGTPLARTKSGTLDLAEDERGEHVIARLNRADPDVRALIPKIERGDLDEMSFAFRVVRDRWEDEHGSEADPATAPRRRILEVSQHRGDVSIVTYGANDATSVGLRALDVALRALRAGEPLSGEQHVEIARLLGPSPSHGMSVRLARAIAAAIERRIAA